MVDAAARKDETRLEVVRLEVGHLLKNLGGVETGGEKVQDVADADAHPADTRTASALLRIDGNAIEQGRHIRKLEETGTRINGDSNPANGASTEATPPAAPATPDVGDDVRSLTPIPGLRVVTQVTP